MQFVGVLREYPNCGNAKEVSKAICKAVANSVNGTLSDEAMSEARRVLGEMAKNPDPTAISGLIDAVVAGSNASGVEAFVLTASAWRILAALADKIENGNEAGRILDVAATSSRGLLLRDDPKKLRVARFHIANMARFAKAFEKNSVKLPDGSCATSIANIFGLVALRTVAKNSDSELHKFCAPLALVLRVVFSNGGDWKEALCASPVGNESFNDVAPLRVMTAIYLMRMARSIEERAQWNVRCEEKLGSDIVPFLFHVLETVGVRMLDVHRPSICAIILSTLKNVCDVCNTNLMLEYVSSSSLLVSRAAMMVLIERAKYGDKDVLRYVRECRLLSEALRSPMATQRWKPLESAIAGDSNEEKITLDNAAELPLLRRMKVVMTAEKRAQSLMARAKINEMAKINRVRAGVMPTDGCIGDVQALARAVVADNVDLKYVESEMKRMEMVTKYARVVATSNELVNMKGSGI